MKPGARGASHAYLRSPVLALQRGLGVVGWETSPEHKRVNPSSDLVVVNLTFSHIHI